MKIPTVKLSQLLIGLVLIGAVIISGCTMSDSDIQNYIDSHPEEIKAYADSHGAEISQYLQEHPEIIEQITFPATPEPLEQTTMAVEELQTAEPTETATTAIQETTQIPTETTVIPTTTPTQVQTIEETIVPTTEPTQEVTTEIPTTIQTTIPTTIATTIPTTEPTPIPTPTPYISTFTGYPAIVDVNGPWTLVSNQNGIKATMTASLNYNSPSYSGVDPYNGIATISGEANNAAIKREDGNPVGVGSLHGTDFSYQFTWHDNLDGTYSTSSIINPLDWSDKSERIIIYTISGTSEELHFSGWPEGTYFMRGD